MSTLNNYLLINSRYDVLMKNNTNQPMVANSLKKFNNEVANIKNLDDLLKNPNVLNVVLKAYNADSIKDATAMLKKLFSEDPEDRKSFANHLSNGIYKEMVNDLGFANGGTGNLDKPETIKKIVDKFKIMSFEESEGQKDSNVRLAMYFKRKAPGLDNWFEVLGDKALSEVVFKTFGFHDSMKLGNIDKLAELLEKRIPLEDFKDPKKLDNFITRFTAMADSQNTMQSNPVLQLFSGSLGSLGQRQIINIDTSLIASFNKNRLW